MKLACGLTRYWKSILFKSTNAKQNFMSEVILHTGEAQIENKKALFGPCAHSSDNHCGQEDKVPSLVSRRPSGGP